MMLLPPDTLAGGDLEPNWSGTTSKGGRLILSVPKIYWSSPRVHWLVFTSLHRGRHPLSPSLRRQESMAIQVWEGPSAQSSDRRVLMPWRFMERQKPSPTSGSIMEN